MDMFSAEYLDEAQNASDAELWEGAKSYSGLAKANVFYELSRRAYGDDDCKAAVDLSAVAIDEYLFLGSEVGELLAEFRWKSDEELNNLDEESLKKISLELADLTIFLLRLSDVMKLDISTSVIEKMKINSERDLKGPNFRKLNY